MAIEFARLLRLRSRVRRWSLVPAIPLVFLACVWSRQPPIPNTAARDEAARRPARGDMDYRAFKRVARAVAYKCVQLGSNDILEVRARVAVAGTISDIQVRGGVRLSTSQADCIRDAVEQFRFTAPQPLGRLVLWSSWEADDRDIEFMRLIDSAHDACLTSSRRNGGIRTVATLNADGTIGKLITFCVEGLKPCVAGAKYGGRLSEDEVECIAQRLLGFRFTAPQPAGRVVPWGGLVPDAKGDALVAP